MKNKEKTNSHSLLLTAHNSLITSRSSTLKTQGSEGITLVALVVTIVVLLILAGITITLLFGDNGIIKKAQDAKDATESAMLDEQEGLSNLEDKMDEILGGNSSGETTPEESGVLEIGSEVTYSPSGTYNWQAKYCSSTKTETTDDVTLSSATGESFNITSWKVLSIDETTGTVELVPSSQTSGTVYLGEAQGYNNGVKLLNDACSELYGDSTKGITARSINIEDIEKYMTATAVAEAHSYVNTNSNTTYGNQVSSAYSTSYSKYPVIYSQEKLAVIDESTPEGANLDLSDTPDNFIERTENGATSGMLTATTSIQPYQTYWYKDATYMSTAFKPYDEENVDKGNYYNLIMPSGTSTTYWVASRCVNANSSICNFRVRYVNSGRVGALTLYYSDDNAINYSLALFPVVTLSSSLISGDATSGFSVQ